MKRTTILVLLALSACGGEKQTSALKQSRDPAETAEPAPPTKNPLRDPAAATLTAPEKFQVRFRTTAGDFVVEAVREWAPHGVDRLYTLVKIGFFNDIVFFRVIAGFMAQFGMHGDPEICAIWSEANIPDDPVRQSNQPGYVTFAKSAQPDSRTTQLFVNTRDNSYLDKDGFAPVGRVVSGMDVVYKLYSGYDKRSNEQGMIRRQGNAWLRENFPKLDSIESATLIE